MTELPDQDLTQLMVEFTRWADYSQTQLAMAEVDESAAEAIVDRARALELLRHMPSSEALRRREDTMTRVKAEVDTSDAVIEMREIAFRAHALRKLLEPRYEAYARDAAVLSRELTRRTERDGTSRRANRWGV